MRTLIGTKDQDPPEPPFTPREKQVLKLLTEDRTLSEIAERLNVSVGTVKQHLRNIQIKIERLHEAGSYPRGDEPA